MIFDENMDSEINIYSIIYLTTVMVFQLRTVRSVLLTKFYSVAAMDAISEEVVSSYDTVVVASNYSSPQLVLFGLAVLYMLLQNHAQIRRVGLLLEDSMVIRNHIRGMLLVLFLVLSRNVQNAI